MSAEDPGGEFGGGLDDIGLIIEQVMEYIRIYLSTFFQYVVTIAYQIINGVWVFLQAFARDIGGFFRHIWDSGFKGVFQSIVRAVQSAHRWLESHLRPLIKFLQRVRAIYDRIYAHYIRPFLVLLQHIRQFLLILRALHINIGTELDRIIAGIENKIAGTFLQIRAVLNNAIDLLNIIADPGNLLRKPTLIISLRRIIPALIRAVTGYPPGYWFPSPRGASSRYFAPVAAGFNPLDPAQNPPASHYLDTDDGTGNVPPIDIGYTLSVDAIDKVDAIDFWDDSLYPAPACSDPIACLKDAILRVVHA
jgi:hypothetical protein